MTVIFIQMHAFHPNASFSMHAYMLSCFSCVRFFAILWTIAHQTPLSMGFPWQEYWCLLPCSPPGDLLDPGIEPVSLKSPALPGMLFTTRATWEAPSLLYANFQRFICSLLDYGNSLLSQPSLSQFSLTPNDLHCSPSLLSATAFPICVSQFSTEFHNFALVFIAVWKAHFPNVL